MAPRKASTNKGKKGVKQPSQNQIGEDIPIASLRTSKRESIPTASDETANAYKQKTTIEITDVDKQLTIGKGTLFDKFLKTNAPVFTGAGGDKEADIWLRGMDKIFARLEGSDEQRVSLATYQLQGAAEDWWDTIDCQYENKKYELTWTLFKKLFLDEYYPWTLRKNKKSELLHLQQDGMTVAEYQVKFNELSRYAPEMVATEEDKVMLFENGLRSLIKERYIMCKSETFHDAAENAKNVEASCELFDKRQEHFQKRQREQPQRTHQNRGDYSNKKFTIGNSSGGNYVQQHRNPCYKCGNYHLFSHIFT